MKHWLLRKKEEKNEEKELKRCVIAVGRHFYFAGHADADSPYARIACMKIFGECPATILPGSARTVVGKMDWEINEN